MSPNGQPESPARSPDELQRLPRPVYGQTTDALPRRILGYRHRHAWGQLSYAAQGVFEIRTERGRFVAPSQRAVWIPAGVGHQLYCPPGSHVRSLYFAAELTPWDDGRCRVLAVGALLRELIRAFNALPVEYAEDGPAGRLVGVLLDQLAAAPEQELVLPLPGEPRLRRLCRSLQAHPDAAAGLAEWSARLGVSEKTLSRLFRRETGLTFRAWRQRLRLFSALPRLEGGERVTDVALACGYDSTSAFIAAFREQFATTPGEFLRPRSGSPAAAPHAN